MQTWQSPHDRPLPAVGGRTLIMGVLNATPDSFSDGGKFVPLQAAVDRAGEMIQAGADVIDLGGESTRPGAAAVPAYAELERVLPVLEALRKAWPEIPISIDTYKAEVAETAIEQGADMINDVWGLMHGLSPEVRARWQAIARSGAPSKEPVPPMAEVAARWKCPVIAMHNRTDRNYTDFWADVLLDLKASLAIAQHAGIDRPQLWLDPGFGFAKNVAQNLEVLRELNRIVALGHPVLVGTSRKSTLGAVLASTVEDRLEGSGATAVWAIQQGCQMVRVHDVREMARFVRMADAIKAGLSFSSG
ncbi:MAG TPA: dihydropteroate synthase [Opitutaceae bacterium]|nr:dihydropteroate synthase [Opitutaceae bacterium]